MLERDITRAILLGTSHLIAWGRNNVGMTADHVRYGVGGVGGADLLGVRRSDGRAVACEVKRLGKHATPEQLRFLACVRSAGGLAFVAHSVEEVLQEIKK